MPSAPWRGFGHRARPDRDAADKADRLHLPQRGGWLCYTDGVSTNANLAVLLADGYQRALDQPFLRVADGPVLSYRDVHDRAGAFAGAIRDQGVEAGDRVMVTAGKSADAVALYLACLRAGAVYLPLNPGFTPAEREFFIDDARPTLVVTDPDQPPVSGVTTLTLDADGAGSLVMAAAAADPLIEAVRRNPDDLAAMLYTSGTTGRPKGAMLTHLGLGANGRALNTIWGFTPEDVLLHSLPIFHVHGLFVALHCAMLSGAPVLFCPKFDLDHVIGLLPEATVMMAVPTHYTRLMGDDRFGPQVCEHMRLFTSGSAPMTAATHEAFEARTGHRILERYGMTEAGIITSNPLGGARVAGTVGFSIPEMDMRIGTDDGGCAPGETGVVEVKGPHVFAGYWQLPDKTAEATRPDGWFITGDVGSLDEEGRLTLEGRSSDVIISGGENIYPKEIEICLDGIDGVIESAVVGLTDPDFGETVTAFVVTNGEVDVGELRTHVNATLARFKHPKRYVLMDALPRNAMGKVQKVELRRTQD
jgi:malonyl-CoA/methylmalonyl-CoA synthetase